MVGLGIEVSAQDDGVTPPRSLNKLEALKHLTLSALGVCLLKEGGGRDGRRGGGGGGEDGRSICEDQENRVSIKGGYKVFVISFSPN